MWRGIAPLIDLPAVSARPKMAWRAWVKAQRRAGGKGGSAGASCRAVQAGCAASWEIVMDIQTRVRPPRSPAASELRFASLFDPGRGVAVPCDASGQVDLDALPERLRSAYFGARAMVGREYAYPVAKPVH
jgi:hypothetical protein